MSPYQVQTGQIQFVYEAVEGSEIKRPPELGKVKSDSAARKTLAPAQELGSSQR